MKKLLAILLVAVFAIALVACDGTGETDDKIKVANLVNGNLGDKSFFDSAEEGLKKLANENIITYKTIEMGATDADQPKWKSTLEEVSAGKEYDLIIVGTWQMADYLKEVAVKYPEQKYAIYDSSCEGDNVVALNYAQNDMGYVVGMLAALFTEYTTIENVNAEKVIGFVGGTDTDVINDFLVGYIQGAQSVVPDIKIDAQYVGNFWDAAAGKEIGNVMISQYNCDVVWGVGGGAGNGAAESCKELGAWYIGVDSDQEKTFGLTQPDIAELVITSGLKKVGDSLYWLLTEMKAGKTYWGQDLSLSFPENGVGVVMEGNYNEYFNADVTAQVNKAIEDIKNGTIVVGTAFGGKDNSVDAIALRATVSPRA